MGVTIEIRVPDQASRDRLAGQWSRAVVDPPEKPAATISAWDGDSDNEVVRDYGVTTRVTMAGLRATAGRRVNLHAGGVADADGRLLALVAPSGTGKTTATRALASRLGYVSDETISIDSEGVVYPHPKPLSVLTDPSSKHHKLQLSPDEVGLLPTPELARLARVVMLHRGGDGPRGLSRLGTAAALLQLVEQSSSMSQLPRPLRTLVGLLHDCGGARVLTYDEIEEHLDDLTALLAEPDDVPPAEELVWHAGQEGFPLVESEGPLLARLPFAEAVEVDHELVVLTESHAWLLADLTAAIWLHVAEPSSMQDLVAAAQERFGAHDRAEEVVRSAVATLAQENLLAWGSLA
jgi:hypothetical protein